jgi:DNA polymerase-3 subunit delta
MQNLFLFFGEDSYTAQKTLKFWKEEFEKKYGDYNIQIIDGEDLSIEEYRNLTRTLPFASDKKLIIVRDFFEASDKDTQQKISDELDSLPDHNVLVFIERNKPDARTSLYKKMVKLGQTKIFPEFEPYDLIQWIKKELEQKNKAGGNLSAQTAQNHSGIKTPPLGNTELNLLAASVGSNLWQMSHELEKLILFSHGRQITSQDIESLISPNLVSSIFKLTDAIAIKNTKNAFYILNTLLQNGEDIFQIFYMIARQFRILLQIKACLNQNMTNQKIITVLKEKPYTIQNGTSQARNFSWQQLQTAYRQLLDIDICLKTSKIRTTVDDNSEFRLALEKFIMKMSKSNA